MSIDAPCVCNSCHSVAAASAAADCVVRCGFALWPSLYDTALLDNVSAAFARWQNDRDDQRRYIDMHGAGVRGRREQIILPAAPSALWTLGQRETDAVVFQPVVADVLVQILGRLGYEAGPAANFVSFIHSPAGSDDQEFHQDGAHHDGIKLQVPLQDVTAELGPLSLVPEQPGCDTLSAVTTKGTAIFYRHTTSHRGTANRATSTNRTVLDFSFMTAAGVEKHDYMHQFSEHAVAGMNQLRLRFAEQCEAHYHGDSGDGGGGSGGGGVCEADGGSSGGSGADASRAHTCASPAAVRAIRLSHGVVGDVPSVPVEGWVGDYRGEGAGEGTYIEPNGSVYEGQFLDGRRHLRGTMRYSNGYVYVGEWKHGTIHGRGRFVTGRGEEYDGEWFEGQRHGRGRAVYLDGSTYEGEFSAGHRHGAGKMVFADGCSFDGTWRMGKYRRAEGVYSCSQRRRRKRGASADLGGSS